MPRKRACDAAAEVLRETDNPRVMWGDSRLLHAIAARIGREPEGWRTEKRVLDALSRTPGELVPGTVEVGRRLRAFWLPEHSPFEETAT